MTTSSYNVNCEEPSELELENLTHLEWFSNPLSIKDMEVVFLYYILSLVDFIIVNKDRLYHNVNDCTTLVASLISHLHSVSVRSI